MRYIVLLCALVACSQSQQPDRTTFEVEGATGEPYAVVWARWHEQNNNFCGGKAYGPFTTPEPPTLTELEGWSRETAIREKFDRLFELPRNTALLYTSFRLLGVCLTNH